MLFFLDALFKNTYFILFSVGIAWGEGGGGVKKNKKIVYK